MSEKIGNPFSEKNFVQGGGLWDGKDVTITKAVTKIDRLTRKDGSVVLNDRTGEPAVRNVLEITGIASDEEKERRETYSAGSLMPTPDGEGFLRPDGTGAAGFHVNSEMAHFARCVEQSGVDISTLWNDETQRMKVSALVGARFTFKGEPQKDKDGKVKKNDKGYEQLKFYPAKFLGMKEGVAAPKANGSAPDAIKAKAEGVILGIIAEAGGRVARAELMRKIGPAMPGDPDSTKVMALAANEEFHRNKPWVKDDTGYSLKQ